ncbi:hypothetical protein ACEWY4_010136 [Coilia grayii]|uniref:Beta/gamma crystallin 'Greek key' domain-containing protein n=1 Tax=Coilia grayii TaxID=363190 RepID=A0ABD1K8I4_9TELE
MKRQNSWQDGIARIFKSYDSDKTAGDSDDTGPENDSKSVSERDDNPDVDGAQDMPKAFQGCEGEEGDNCSDRDTQEISVLDNEAGSESEPPDRQLSTLGPPKSPGPSSPVPASDSFLKRLGNLFHFFSKAESRALQLEQNSTVPLSSLCPEGITCGLHRSLQASETTELSRGDSVGPCGQEMDKPPSQQENSALEDKQAAIVAAPTDPEGQMPKSLLSVEEDYGTAQSPDTNCLPLRQDSDEGQQQTFEGPAVVTHTTYRGQKEVRKMRRRQHLQIYSPISEGNESQLSRGSVSSEGEGSPCPLSLSADLPQASKLTAELIDMCSEQSKHSLPMKEDHLKASSQAAGVQLAYAQDAVLPCMAEDNAPPEYQGCQEASLSLLLPDVRNSENNSLLCANKSLDAQSPDQAAGLVDYNQSIVTSAAMPHLHEDNLQCESKAMVEIILRNALTALQEMETSKESDSCESDVECKPFVFAAIRHGYREDNYDFKLATQELEDKHVVPTNEDDQVLSSRAQGEGSRSTFSSGYESIAGSDTDIRSSPGQSYEGSPQSLPTIGQQFESPSVVMPGITKEEATEHPESDNTNCKKNKIESVSIKTNTTFVEVKDGDSEVCIVTDDKPAIAFEVNNLHFYSCLGSEPEVHDVSNDIIPNFPQNSEQSVDIDPVSRCTIQSGSVDEEDDKLVPGKVILPGTVIVNTAVAITDSFSSECEPEEKVQNQEDMRPKPLQIAQESLESYTINGKAITEPTCFSDCESSPEWTTTVANQCAISEDWCQSSEMYVEASDVKESFTALAANTQDKNVDLEQSGSSIILLVSAPPPPLLYPGFPLIGEEEEMDDIFVNDTGPMERPSAARRGKIYPFSLSPILEEEENLQVPPATEEELKSSEQQACSILSLLQSVSERLQSSAFSDGDPETCTDSLDAFPCPRWYSLSDSEGIDEKDHLTDQDVTLPSKISEKDETEMVGSTEQAANGLPHEVPEEKDWVSLLTKPKRITSSPYYDYLKTKPTSLPIVENINEGKISKALVREELPILGKIIPRPSVMHIYKGVTFSGEEQTIFSDVFDTGGMAFKTGASIQVQAGCWLLYVEAGFRGSCVVLEEGEKILTRGEKQVPQQNDNSTDSTDQVHVGSIRTVVKDDGIPEIHCHGECESPVVLYSQREDLKAVQISNFTVKSGCWLAYEDTGFSGNFAVLETEGKISYGPGSPISQARSLRPLTRGGPKVRRPLDPKMVLYELPGFRGQSRELLANMPQVEGLQRVCSLRVLSGIWVGYSREHYRGRQCLVEEGEYGDCRELCGSDCAFLSFRFLLSDCIEPAISLKNALSSETAPMDIVDQDVPDMENLGGPNLVPVSISVKSGVWVAYSGKFFSENQYVLEKGQHSDPLDWGDCSGKVMSIRPVRLSGGIRGPKHLIRAYSEPHFCGEHQEYGSKVADCSSIHPMSFRVIHGSWVLFDEEGCSGNQFVLTEGLYPNLMSCGNVGSAIRSLKPVPNCFSDPSISLFSLDSFEGLETTALMTMDDLNGFFTQSVRVNSGLWVVYEYSNFKGRQMLLSTGSYSMWAEHSGWDTIGSLQPLRQPKAYVQLRNRALGSVLTAESTQDKDSPARMSLKAPGWLDCQQWILIDGLLKCKVGKACMSVIGGKALVGARVALWPEHGRTHQRWSLNEDGTISSHLNPSLVLDIRGGNGIDRDHFIVNQCSSDQSTQYWDIELA